MASSQAHKSTASNRNANLVGSRNNPITLDMEQADLCLWVDSDDDDDDLIVAAPTDATRNHTTPNCYRQWMQTFRALLDGLGPRRFVASGVLEDLSTRPSALVHDVGRLECPLQRGALEALHIVANSCHRERMVAQSAYQWNPNPALPNPPKRTWAIDAFSPSQFLRLAHQARVTVQGGNGTGGWDTYLKAKVVDIWTNKLGFPLTNTPWLEVSLHQLIVATAGEDDAAPQWMYPEYNRVMYDLVGVLVVQVRSQFTGGAFKVQRHDKVETFNLAPDRCSYVAFYPDCPYQVEPVTTGVCLRLIYHVSLFRIASGVAVHDPSATKPFLSAAESRLVKSLERSQQTMAKDWNTQGLARLGYPLDHDYDVLGARFLKGRDRLVYTTLMDAKAVNGEHLWDVFLVGIGACSIDPNQGRDANNPRRTYTVKSALDREGHTVMIVFNRSDGTTNGEFFMQQDGWFMDTKYFVPGTGYSSVCNMEQIPTWRCTAAIFISPARDGIHSS